MTYVTCPIMRYHPAVVAQKAATVGLLSDGRFTLGLGAGEPQRARRRRGLAGGQRAARDARGGGDDHPSLLDGGYVNFKGDHYRVDSAKLWDRPESRLEIAVAVSGDQSIETFAPMVDHLVAVEPRRSWWPPTPRTRGSRARSGRSRSAGTPTGTARSAPPTSSSAGSPAAGRSTPSCRPPRRLRGRHPVRHPRRRRGLDPVRTGPRRDRGGRLRVREGRLHRRGAGADRRREPGGVPRGRGARAAARAPAPPADPRARPAARSTP